MPISVLCPSCNSKLNAPDAAAGKRVKCPKCQVLMELPAPEPDFEIVDDEPPVMAKPKPKSPSKPVVDE
jgi:phage FluMu protein Com